MASSTGGAEITAPPIEPLSHEFVLTFLTADERLELPEVLRGKIALSYQELTRKYHNTINQKQKDRIAYEQEIESLSNQLKEVRERTRTSDEELKNERKTVEEYVDKYRTSLNTINTIEVNLHNTQSNCNEKTLKVEHLSSAHEELLVILDKRIKEIETLNDEKKKLSERLQQTTGAKIDALMKVDELTSTKLELDYKEKELEKEREWVNKQVQLLNSELDRKNKQIIDIQREATMKMIQTHAELSQKTEELRQRDLDLVNIKGLNSSQEAQIERLLQKLRESSEIELKMEENYRVELQSQTRIAQLYKESGEESMQKIHDLETAVGNLQDLLTMATERYGDLETKFNSAAKSFQEEIAQRDEKLSTLQSELKQANELLHDLHEKGLTDEMIESLSPAAAAVSHLLRGTQSLTEIYSKLTKSQEELLAVRAENNRLSDYVHKIVDDITVRGPVLKAQREDYQRSLETIDALTNQLELSMDSEAKAREDFALQRKTLGSLERENTRIRTQINDNANQIKVLLREIESLRGTYVFEADNQGAEFEGMNESGVLDSSHLISNRLVTFRNIDELQSQNAYLLALVRDLTEEREKSEASAESQQLDEIKAAYEEVRRELEELKEIRMRHESFVRGSYQEASTHTSPQKPLSTTPVPESTQKSTITREAEANIIRLETKYNELKEDYETYRREKVENEKMASEQMERLRDDLSRLRSENVKLASQVEYNNERSKIYTSNLETHKKTINALEEKNKQLAVTVAKHEETVQLLRNEMLINHEKLSRAEVSLGTIQQERNSLRDAKSQLTSELTLYKREERTCKILETNLAEIKNNIEMANADAKLRLDGEIESLRTENSFLRRKVEAENEKLSLNVSSWDKVNKDLEKKLEIETEKLEKVTAELTASQASVRTQRSEVDKLLGQVRVLSGGSGTSAVVESLESAEAKREAATRELTNQIATLERECSSYKEQIQVFKSSLEEYKGLARSLEEELNGANREMVEEKLRCKDDMIRELQSKLDSTEKEATILKQEKEDILKDVETKSVNLRSEIGRLERDAEVVKTRLEAATEERDKLKVDVEKQEQLTKEFQSKYENELSQHYQVVENRNEIRNDLDTTKALLNSIERMKVILEAEVKEIRSSWVGREKGLVDEIERLTATVTDLDKVNTTLQEQLITLSSQVEGAKSLDTSGTGSDLDLTFSAVVDDSLSEDDNKRTTAHWIQLLKYMRRQKEIAYRKVELAESTVIRLQSQLEFTEKQQKEVEEKYAQLQSHSQTSLITSSKTTELLRKIETLSALTDSNRMLREERENLIRQVDELRTRATTSESKLEPLTSRNVELDGKLESLRVEIGGVRADLGRWRARANALIDKTNKFNPEEMKKITAEKDAMTKQLAVLEESRKKMYAETTRLDAQAKTLQNQNTQVHASLQTTNAENRKLAEELRKVNEYKTGLVTELEKVQKELGELRKQIEGKVGELEISEGNLRKATAEVEEQKGMVKQVKNIARKYKKSYEDSLKELETAKVKPEGESGSAEAIAEASRANEERVNALELKVTELSNEKDTLQTEIEGLKEKEERAKVAMKTLRDKIANVNQQRTEQETEFNLAKTKLSNLEANTEEANVRLAAVKSQLEGRVSRLEKENKDLKVTAQQGVGSNSELTAENEGLKKENEIQKQRILALEKQFIISKSQQQGPGVSGTTPKTSTAPGDKTHPTDPPKANIKPIAGGTGPKAATTQVVPPSTSRPQPTASIRPMSMTRKATVMPTAAAPTPPQQQVTTQQASGGVQQLMSAAAAPVSQAQVSTSTPDQSTGDTQGHQQLPVTSSAPTGTVTNSTNVRQATVQPTPAVSVTPITTPAGPLTSTGTSPVPPQQGSTTDTTSGSIGQEGPSTSTTSHVDSEMGDSSEQVSSSEPSSHQPVLPVAPIRSTQEVEGSSQVTPASSEVEAGAVTVQEEPSPSTSTSRPTQSSKRSRDNEVETTEEGQPRDEPEPKRTRIAPQSSEIDREAEPMSVHVQDQSREGPVSEDDDEPQVPHSGRKGTVPSTGLDEEDEDSDVVVIESDEEGEVERQEDDEEEEEEMGEEEEEVDPEEGVEEDEDEDDGGDDRDVEIMEQEDAEEGREAESIEEIEEEGSERGEDEGESAHGNLEEGESNEQEENSGEEILLVDVEDEFEVDMNQEAGEASPANPNEEPSTGQSGPTPPAQLTPVRQGRQERGTVYGRHQQQFPMTPSFHMYAEETDDSIVPSTPTLFVPRRTDGFSEAVSSPHVSSGRQFIFGGMDESRLDVLHYDESSGRSVPTTPLQVSPPGELLDDDVEGVGREEGELGPGDGPTSSDGHHPTHQNIPSITLSTPSDDPSQEPNDIPMQLNQAGGESAVDGSGTVPRPEFSVTSSDEDKLERGNRAGSQSQSALRVNSPTPSSFQAQESSQQQAEQQLAQQQRTRPTPIVWDQPTSSSSTSAPVVQQSLRGVHRTGRIQMRGTPPLHAPHHHPTEQGSLRGGFRPRGGQSARRSRPHGRGGVPRGY